MTNVPHRAIRVLVSHLNPLIQSGLASALDLQPGFSVQRGQGAAPSHYLIEGRLERPSVVVCDYHSAMELLALHAPSGRRDPVAVVVVSGNDSECEVREVFARGAKGYLTTDCSFEELADAVRAVHLGTMHLCRRASQRMAESLSNDPLTTRENEVLHLIAKGLSNKIVARQLDVSVGTVKSHMRALMGKLRVVNRTEAVIVAERRGLIPRQPEAVAQVDSSNPPALQPKKIAPRKAPLDSHMRLAEAA